MVVVSSSNLDGWSSLKQLKTRQDVATLLSAYKKCSGMYSPEYIDSVVERDGYYGFVLNPNGVGKFDLFKTINENYSYNGITVNCANALLLFPETLSRGEFMGQEEDTCTGVFEDDVDDSPTGLLDEEDVHYVIHLKTNTELPVDSYNGFVVGRSVSRTDYSVDNNMLSRVHARFFIHDGRCFVEDLGSRNGTFVNNIRVRPNNPTELHKGCLIRLANEEFKFL